MFFLNIDMHVFVFIYICIINIHRVHTRILCKKMCGTAWFTILFKFVLVIFFSICILMVSIKFINVFYLNIFLKCSHYNMLIWCSIIIILKVKWYTIKYGALRLSHPKCTHTRSSGQPCMLRRPGSSWGFSDLLKGTSVVVLKVKREMYIHSPHLQFLPDLRLKPSTFRLQVLLSNH